MCAWCMYVSEFMHVLLLSSHSQIAWSSCIKEGQLHQTTKSVHILEQIPYHWLSVIFPGIISLSGGFSGSTCGGLFTCFSFSLPLPPLEAMSSAGQACVANGIQRLLGKTMCARDTNSITSHN